MALPRAVRWGRLGLRRGGAQHRRAPLPPRRGGRRPGSRRRNLRQCAPERETTTRKPPVGSLRHIYQHNRVSKDSEPELWYVRHRCQATLRSLLRGRVQQCHNTQPREVTRHRSGTMAFLAVGAEGAFTRERGQMPHPMPAGIPSRQRHFCILDEPSRWTSCRRKRQRRAAGCSWRPRCHGKPP